MNKNILQVSFYCFSLPVLNMTLILIQTLLTTPSNGNAHLVKQFPWYLGAFMFIEFS